MALANQPEATGPHQMQLQPLCLGVGGQPPGVWVAPHGQGWGQHGPLWRVLETQGTL